MTVPLYFVTVTALFGLRSPIPRLDQRWVGGERPAGHPCDAVLRDRLEHTDFGIVAGAAMNVDAGDVGLPQIPLCCFRAESADRERSR